LYELASDGKTGKSERKKGQTTENVKRGSMRERKTVRRDRNPEKKCYNVEGRNVSLETENQIRGNGKKTSQIPADTGWGGFRKKIRK